VVAEPNGADVLAGEADEPGVLGTGRGARLAGDVREVELRRLAGALGDDLVHHPVEPPGDLAVDDLRGLRLVAIAAVDEIALGADEIEDGIRLCGLAPVWER